MNRALIVVVSAYVAAQMMADVASLRIVDMFGFAVDAGTLIYPFTFTLRDLVHKLAGKSAARTVIFTAAAVNVAMAGLFRLVADLPADELAGPQVEFGVVLAPVWRIVAASIVAEVVAELIDTEVYQRWVDRLGRRHQWGRVLVSNAVSVPVDSALFVSIAFWGVLPGSVTWEIFWVNIAFKGVISLLSVPWIYWVRPAEPVGGARMTR
jgi:queuosine precursor transporter